MKFGLREALFTLVLMLIPVGAWWFIFRPQNANNASLKEEIALRQAKLQKLNLALGTIGDLEAEIESLEEAIAYFQSKLPGEKEIDKILQEIWLLAEDNNLKAKSIRPLNRKSALFTNESSPQAEQPIAIQLEGNFSGFYAFLLALEDQPRIMRVGRMNIEVPSRSPGPGYVEIGLEISIFFEPNAKGQS